jgi:PAS domain-containing protein
MPVISDMAGLQQAAISVALLAVAAGLALLRRRRLEAPLQRTRLGEEGARNGFCETNAQRRFTDRSGAFAGLDDPPMARRVGCQAAEQQDAVVGGEGDGTRTAAARLPVFHELQRIRLADGRVRYWRASSGPVFDEESGAFLGYRGTAADVTDTVLRDAARSRSS